jgi:hypothetical protein
MITVEHKPKTYRGKVHWYVSNWNSRVIELFTSKSRALRRAKEQNGKLHPDDQRRTIINVSWFDWKADPKRAISTTATFIDRRNENGH